MQTKSLVDRLGEDLQPVRPRNPRREMLLLLLLALAEMVAIVELGFMRPDMPDAMDHASFWWKLASMGIIAVIAGIVALVSIDPARSPRPGLRWILACIAAIFATGWLIDASQAGVAHLLTRLDWRNGLQCVWRMVVLSIPPAIALSVLIRRGAPTDRTGTSLAAGLSCAACGAFIFTVACPSDDPLYIAVWYTVACSIVTAIAGTIIKRVSRW